MANDFEMRVEKFLVENGWNVYDSGWPDFLCIREDPKTKEPVLLVVEAKSRHDVFRGNQMTVLQALSTVMKVYTVREVPASEAGEGGFRTLQLHADGSWS